MPVFDIVVLGCGGGPNEHNLSSYLLKSSCSPWSDGIVAVEAGSGIGALAQLLRNQPDLFGTRVDEGSTGQSKPYSPTEIYSWIKCYLITHAHLDHINSLIISAGSFEGPKRKIHASLETLQNIESVFTGPLWPNLASWDEDSCHAALLYSKMSYDEQYHPISSDILVRSMPLSHGKDPNGVPCESSAFFIKNESSQREILFFGDVEPDSVADNPRTLDVWRVAAQKIPHSLDAIFIECSWPVGRADGTLYGHLNPEHLSAELIALGAEVAKVRQETLLKHRALNSEDKGHTRKKQKLEHPTPESLRGILDGVRVYIIHCKEDLGSTYDQPINHVIANQVRELTEVQGLGVDIIAVEQGMVISV